MSHRNDERGHIRIQLEMKDTLLASIGCIRTEVIFERETGHGAGDYIATTARVAYGTCLLQDVLQV